MAMKGIVRPIDNLGRIVLPIEWRKTLDIDRGDSLEICVDDKNIILKKYEESCVFCGSTDSIQEFKGKNVCKKCKKEISK